MVERTRACQERNIRPRAASYSRQRQAMAGALVIAALIGATGTSREAGAKVDGSATFASTLLLIPVAFECPRQRR